MYSRQIVVVNKDSGIENLADLNGKRVAVQVTSKPEYILTNTNTPQVGVLYSMSTMEELYASMRKGYVDAIAGHENAMNVFVQSNEEHFGVLREELSVSELGIAFSLDNKDEKEQLEEILNDNTNIAERTRQRTSNKDKDSRKREESELLLQFKNATENDMINEKKEEAKQDIYPNVKFIK